MLPGLDAVPLRKDWLKLFRRAMANGGAAVSRAALGAGAMGDSLFQAATAAAARVLLGLPTQVASMVRLNTGNGQGSSSTAYRRFTNVVTNQGSDISYGDSATLGGIFTIITAGVYAISYTDTFSSAIDFGISLNSSQPTTNITSITAADRLCSMATGGANFSGTVSTTVYLPAGSVIHAHTNPAAVSGATPALTQFTIVRVG